MNNYKDINLKIINKELKINKLQLNEFISKYNITNLDKLFDKINFEDFDKKLKIFTYYITKYELNNLRKNIASVKNRSAVRGGGKKPRPQKGTGKSRMGSIRSPLCRGGGVIFGPTKRNFKEKINKKTWSSFFYYQIFDLISKNKIFFINISGLVKNKKDHLKKLKTFLNLSELKDIKIDFLKDKINFFILNENLDNFFILNNLSNVKTITDNKNSKYGGRKNFARFLSEKNKIFIFDIEYLSKVISYINKIFIK